MVSSACHEAPLRDIYTAGTGAHAWLMPRVRIESEREDESWHPLLVDGVPEDDTGTNLISVVSEIGSHSAAWCHYWLMPASVESGHYRMRVTMDGGAGITLYPSGRGQ